MAATDLDARDILEFFVGLAEQDAVLVADYLLSAGIEPGTALPKNVLLKLGVYCRLAFWEDVGLTAGANEELPSARAVFVDALAELEGDSPQLDAVVLCRRTHMFALRRLTWPQTSGASTFTLDDRADSSELLDGVAELLWHYRHLADGHVSVPPTTVQDEAAKEG
jgi:hypothetical protein